MAVFKGVFLGCFLAMLILMNMADLAGWNKIGGVPFKGGSRGVL